MIYAKVDVKLRDHERAHRAGAAMATWTWALLYACEQETDGFIPSVTLRLCWVGEKEGRRHATTLVAVGLWEPVDGGWRICRYGEKNATREQIAARRRETAERVASHRQKRVSNALHGVVPATLLTERVAPLVPGSGSGSRSGSDPEGVQGGGPPSVPPEEPSEVKPSMARYREAYCAGIAEGKGSPYAWPNTKFDDEQLGSAIMTFGRSKSTGQALRGEKLLGWIRAAAADFAEHVVSTGDDPKFWSHFAPKGFVRFLNQDRQTEEARRVG